MIRRTIIIRASVFLLLGAIVNVAVAWAFARSHLYVGYCDLGARYAAGWSVSASDYWGYTRIMSSWVDRDPSGEHPSARSTFTSRLPYWASFNIDVPTYRNRDYHFSMVEGFGWPSRTLMCETGPAGYVSGGIALAAGNPHWGGTSGFVGALPYRPIWPGFVINTLFYAALLWGLFAAPFALRRRRRIKRGLCPKCAYPIGASDVCTECGAPVTPQHR